MEYKPTQRMLENAHKVAYLVAQYPNKKLGEIIGMFVSLPAVEINTAIWYAVELGFIKEPDAEQNMALANPPETWQFGESVDNLMAMIMFAFTKLGAKQEDLEENYLNNWVSGYRPYDILIAEGRLLETKQLVTYQLTDPKDLKSTYTFYTLYENGEQMWGRKQFKEQPTGAEVPDTSVDEAEPTNSDEAAAESETQGEQE